MTFKNKPFIVSVVALTICVAVIAIACLSWPSILYRQFSTAMERAGFQHSSLSIRSANSTEAHIRASMTGSRLRLAVRNADIHYSIESLWHKRVHSLSLSGLMVHGDMGKESTFPFLPPTDMRALQRYPFDRLSVKDGQITLYGGGWRLTTQLAFDMQATPEGKISYSGQNLSLAGVNRINAAASTATLALAFNKENGQWTGPWALHNITLHGTPQLPPLNGEGDLTIMRGRLMAEGIFSSADSRYNLTFRLNYSISNPEQRILTIITASLPLEQGAVSIRRANIPLDGHTPISAVIDLSNISLDNALQRLTRGHMKNTGVVSGTLPVTIGENGKVTINNGYLQATTPGVLSLPPDRIHGEDAQGASERKQIQNLHYDRLMLSLNGPVGQNGKGDRGEELAATLTTTQGKKTAIHGKSAQFSVTLHDDTLDFIQWAILRLTFPGRMLRQAHP